MANRYPEINAGDLITADLLSRMIPRIISKGTTESRSSVTTPSDDSELTMELEANSVYFVEFHIHYAALAAAGFQTTWTVPSGSSGNRCVIGPGSNVSAASVDNVDGRFGVHNYDTKVEYGTRNHTSNQCYALETSTLVTTQSGTLALQWSQEVSDSSETSVYNTSLMRATRIG